MKKTLGLAAAAAVVLPMAVPAAAMADDSSSQQVPSLNAAFQTWNYGGAEVGGGAAKLVSGAVIGIPQLVTVLPFELVGNNAPGQSEYVGPDTDLGTPMAPGN